MSQACLGSGVARLVIDSGYVVLVVVVIPVSILEMLCRVECLVVVFGDLVCLGSGTC